MSKYKLKIILRQEIINPINKCLHDDEGLKALNGYFESNIEIVDANNVNEAIEIMRERYKNKLKLVATIEAVFIED